MSEKGLGTGSKRSLPAFPSSESADSCSVDSGRTTPHTSSQRTETPCDLLAEWVSLAPLLDPLIAGLVSLPSPRSLSTSHSKSSPAPFFLIVTTLPFLADDLLYCTVLKVSADASRLRRRIKEAVLAEI